VRNYSLDLLRGLTVAFMIVVNNPGDWKEMFVLLRHAEWHGFLGADIVFPLFLFVSGYAAALRIEGRYAPLALTNPHCASALTLEIADQPPYYLPLVRRAALLFCIGLFLNAWPFGLLPGTDFSLEKLRVFGVLQRIAICVLVGGVLLRRIGSVKGLFSVLILIAVVYEIGMRVPLVQTTEGIFGRSFELADNFSRFVDMSILPAGMLYKVQKIPFDPEGLFTSLTAVLTFLIGALAYRLTLVNAAGAAGAFWRSLRARTGFTFAILCIGLLLLSFEPVNKNLWTLPYVLLTGAAAIMILFALEKADIPHRRFVSHIAQLFADMGRNPLVIYVLSGVVGKALALWKLEPQLSVKQYFYQTLAAFPLAPKFQSLCYSLLLLFAVALLAHVLRRLPLRV
jgi:predicted acyltransferase